MPRKIPIKICFRNIPRKSLKNLLHNQNRKAKQNHIICMDESTLLEKKHILNTPLITKAISGFADEKIFFAPRQKKPIPAICKIKLITKTNSSLFPKKEKKTDKAYMYKLS